MKKIANHFLFSFVIFILTAKFAFAGAIFTIVPSITNTTLRSDGLTEVIFTVTNSSPQTLSNITINPAFNTTGNRPGITLQNNTCSSLTPGANCTFQVLMQGANQPSSFIISPRVCAFNGGVCSQPTAANRLSVTVYNITGDVFAYIRQLISGVYKLLPINAGNLVPGNSTNVSTSFGGVAVSMDGKKVYIVAGAQVNVFNSGSPPSLITSVSLPSSSSAIALTPNGSKAYVSNESLNEVYVINTVTNSYIKTIPVGDFPFSITASPDGSKVYVGNYNDLNVSVIDTNTDTVVATIPIGGFPLGVFVSPDGSRLYVTSQVSNRVEVVSTSTNTIIASINLPGGSFPASIVASPDGSRVYTANTGGSVSVINAINNTFITNLTLSAPGAAFGAAITPNGDKLFISRNNVNPVVVNTSDNSLTPIISVTGPRAVVGNFVG